jgi:hypothetical protein
MVEGRAYGGSTPVRLASKRYVVTAWSITVLLRPIVGSPFPEEHSLFGGCTDTSRRSVLGPPVSPTSEEPHDPRLAVPALALLVCPGEFPRLLSSQARLDLLYRVNVLLPTAHMLLHLEE